MLVALDRYLKEYGFKYSINIIRDREFQQSKMFLEKKVKSLRQQGNRKRPKAASNFTREQEEMLRTEKILSDDSPLKRTFPDNVVAIGTTFWIEGKTGTPFNASREIRFLYR